MMTAVGHTGSRHGQHEAQHAKLEDLLLGLPLPITEAHHGMCVGSDTEFHHLIRQHFPDAVIHGWPASDVAEQWKADMEVDVLHEPNPALVRNRLIVAASEVMTACPYEATEVRRSGTWSTIRYATKARASLAIVRPDGSLDLRPVVDR